MDLLRLVLPALKPFMRRRVVQRRGRPEKHERALSGFCGFLMLPKMRLGGILWA